MSLNQSKIDYLLHAKAIINRPGYSLNIVTGCRHEGTEICQLPCWAMKMIRTRLKGHPSYPYGTEPTFHPERIRKYGGIPKLIFLNDMGDVGGDWMWKVTEDHLRKVRVKEDIAWAMRDFALMNSQHIILLLTKRPEWYRMQIWPDNVWCGFTATNNGELANRWTDIKQAGVKRNRIWVSLEPWLDFDRPGLGVFDLNDYFDWLVIGGLTGSKAFPGRALSEDTIGWVQSYQGPLFVKKNTRLTINIDELKYPEEWRV